MNIIKTGLYKSFLDVLNKIKNTVYGRHFINIVMAAIKTLKKEDKVEKEKGRFKFIKYKRSNNCNSVRDNSISYYSIFTIF
jgi:predicted class III extradiol MEMO1 family dioxygenase